MKIIKLISFVSVIAFCAATTQAQDITRQFQMPQQIKGTVTAMDCNNSGGPFVTLDSSLLLGGLQIQLVLKNNVQGTHTAVVTYTTNASLITVGEAIKLPKQPVQGGVGGNPHIWLQFHDGAGNNLTEEYYLGRCVQGLKITPDILASVIASADVEVFDCSNAGGPNIKIGGSLTLSGLHARFIFSNNFKKTHEASVVRDVKLVANGSKVSIPKQPVQGGAGGNPIISIQLLQGNGTPIGEPVTLGRCVQL